MHGGILGPVPPTSRNVVERSGESKVAGETSDANVRGFNKWRVRPRSTCPSMSEKSTRSNASENNKTNARPVFVVATIQVETSRSTHPWVRLFREAMWPSRDSTPVH